MNLPNTNYTCYLAYKCVCCGGMASLWFRAASYSKSLYVLESFDEYTGLTADGMKVTRWCQECSDLFYRKDKQSMRWDNFYSFLLDMDDEGELSAMLKRKYWALPFRYIREREKVCARFALNGILYRLKNNLALKQKIK